MTEDEVTAQIWALQEKVECLSAHETCACSLESPDDLCMQHSPKLLDAVTRYEKAEAALEQADRYSHHLERFIDTLTDKSLYHTGYQDGRKRWALAFVVYSLPMVVWTAYVLTEWLAVQ